MTDKTRDAFEAFNKWRNEFVNATGYMPTEADAWQAATSAERERQKRIHERKLHSFIKPMLQDESRGLSKWLADKPDALQHVKSLEVQPEHDKLLTIIASAYQIAGACDAPAHILDVLGDPVNATQDQIDAMLPFVQPAKGFQCEPQPAVTDDGFCDWVCPKPLGYLMQCCDCGLIHEVESQVAKYQPRPSEEYAIVNDPDLQVQWRMKRRDDLAAIRQGENS